MTEEIPVSMRQAPEKWKFISFALGLLRLIWNSVFSCSDISDYIIGIKQSLSITVLTCNHLSNPCLDLCLTDYLGT